MIRDSLNRTSTLWKRTLGSRLFPVRWVQVVRKGELVFVGIATTFAGR
jgi:hypothetical protein